MNQKRTLIHQLLYRKLNFDLMPKHPIYVALLPEAARNVIGKTHPAGAGARRYLEAEGFRYDGTIDIFDAGPSLKVPRDELRTIRHSRLETIHAAREGDELNLQALLRNDSLSDFRCALTQVGFRPDSLRASPNTLKILNLSEGDQARIWIKR